jgi:hypothetical protein
VAVDDDDVVVAAVAEVAWIREEQQPTRTTAATTDADTSRIRCDEGDDLVLVLRDKEVP